MFKNMKKIKLTSEVLDSLQSGNGGYTRSFADLIGIGWPLYRGWKHDVAEQNLVMTIDDIKKLMEAQKITKLQSPLKEKSRRKKGVLLKRFGRPAKLDMTITETYETRDKFMGMSYSEYLKSDHWTELRKKAKRRVNYQKCKFCGIGKDIDLHHTSYKWIGTKEELRCVIALCRTHHYEVHEFSKVTGLSVRKATIEVGRMYRNKNHGTFKKYKSLYGFGKRRHLIKQ